MKKSTKASLGIAAAAVLAVTGTIVAFAQNSSDGPNRPTYGCEGADHVVFNSISATECKGKPTKLGASELYFTSISEYGKNNWVDHMKVENGKTYTLRMFVHNNAVSDPDGDNKIEDESTIARDVAAKLIMKPTENAKSTKNDNGQVVSASAYEIQGRVMASNAKPQMVQDEAYFESANGEEFKLAFKDAYYFSSYNGGTKIGDLTKADLFSSNGAKIGYDALDGNMPGCTKYSGWVYVDFTVKQDETTPSTPALTIEKEVRNVTKDGDKVHYGKDLEIHANSGDELKYRIYIENNGSETTPVYLKDVIDENLDYQEGTAYIKYGKNCKTTDNGCEVVEQKISDEFMTRLTTIKKELAPGADINLFYTAKVKNNGLDELCHASTLPNRAELHYKKNIEDKTEKYVLIGEDTVSVVIDGKECHEAAEIDKYAQLAKNDPKDESTWHNDGSLKAARGENVRFRIRFFNKGDTTLKDVALRDPLEGTGFTLDTSKKITLSRVNSDGKSGGIVTLNDLNNIKVGDVAEGQTVILIFEAYVPTNDSKETLVCEDKTLYNYAYGKFSDKPEMKTEEAVIITADDCSEDEKHPGYSIEKFVQVKGDKKFYKKVTTKAGETVRYQIKFKNTGDTTLKRVVISDTLDARLTYNKGTTTVLRNGKEQKIESDEITTKGVVIGDYKAGEEAIVYFYATVKTSLADDCDAAVIPNKATGKYNNDDSTRKTTDQVNVEVPGKVCKEPETPKEPELPKTGATSAFGIIAGVASISTAAAYYINSRKKLN